MFFEWTDFYFPNLAMSKLVSRIFKKKSSKTLEDLNGSVSPKEEKNGSLPRSKTTHLNGKASSPQDHLSSNGVKRPQKISTFPGDQSSKSLSAVRSPPRSANNDKVISPPVEIPVEEALQLIAEDPPHVARSTPKGLETVDTKRWKEEHEMLHCIYDRAVYEKMIDNSLKTCDLLQKNLDSYIEVVRQTPSRGSSPVKIQH